MQTVIKRLKKKNNTVFINVENDLKIIQYQFMIKHLAQLE